MASFHAVKKAVTISPTVRTLPTGVPTVPFLNLVARAPSHGHDDHGHGPGPRSDRPARFVGGVKTTSSGLISKTFMGAYRLNSDPWSCIQSTYSTTAYYFSTPLHPYFRAS